MTTQSNAEKILNDLIMSDGFDELVAYRLEKSLHWTMEMLEQMDPVKHDTDELMETIHYCRSIVGVLQAFTLNQYEDTLKKINKTHDAVVDNFFREFL